MGGDSCEAELRNGECLPPSQKSVGYGKRSNNKVKYTTLQ